ncbi:hypothetical protein GCM10009560_64290 [Nonomuraea longicatena]|uniref:Uncharacterized protein n=1 Tax=Nonomuraea longicatena TaxID=83682 RepID=A0ABN1QV41_9ACTN
MSLVIAMLDLGIDVKWGALGEHERRPPGASGGDSATLRPNPTLPADNVYRRRQTSATVVPGPGRFSHLWA